MYWNGIQWTTTDSTFKLYFDNQGQTDHCINRSFPVKNNITWDMGLEGEGYAIPMPSTSDYWQAYIYIIPSAQGG